MLAQFRFFPDQAATNAQEVDPIFFYLTGISGLMSIAIATLIVVFAITYRRRSPYDRPPAIHTHLPLEIAWSVIPLFVFISFFVWGASVYFKQFTPTADAMEISVLGKQWMWKLQHPQGRREINELHVPLGKPVKLNMISQDVIHSFFVPAFRMKQDVLPGRYTVQWFTPSKIGEYHLFCAEYCGTLHSNMIGTVYVMDPAAYQAWLAGAPADESPVAAGERLYIKFSCNACHGIKAPTLAGLIGREVKFTTGETITADENYIRESILNSTARIVAGYGPLMPSYRGQLSEEQIMQLIAYIKSLTPTPGPDGKKEGPQ
jgi:cytochrome c oxidase subunit 2